MTSVGRAVRHFVEVEVAVAKISLQSAVSSKRAKSRAHGAKRREGEGAAGSRTKLPARMTLVGRAVRHYVEVEVAVAGISQQSSVRSLQ